MNNMVLSPEEEYLEIIVDNIKCKYTLEGIAILRKEFKQCFQAAREKEFTTTGDIDDIPGVVVSYKYDDFENYLTQLDNESNSRY